MNISLSQHKIYQCIYLEELCFIFDQVIPVVSRIEFHLPDNPNTPKNIGEALKGPQRKFWKEALSFQYYNKSYVNLLSAFIPMKYLPGVNNFIQSLIDPSIKEGDCYSSWKFFAHHCANRISQIQYIDFDQSYSPVAYSDLFRINIAIEVIHRLTAIILGVSNAFQNKNVPIHEIFCVSPSRYYLDWFENIYPDVTLNSYYGPFSLQCMNEIQCTNPVGCNCKYTP